MVLRPRHPESKGQVDRSIGYLETSFVPLRTAGDLRDLQTQADQWSATVADQRRLRWLDARVADALLVERASLRRLPERWPTLTGILRSASVGMGRAVAGVDYSVRPRLAGRHFGVRLSPTEVLVACEGAQVARHMRSWVPADVVKAAVHARQLRLARQASQRLQADDPEVATADLARYDQLAEVGL